MKDTWAALRDMNWQPGFIRYFIINKTGKLFHTNHK